ncbi:MAG TPA: DUF3140 domain-containing protein [Sphingomicrobium sp.]|jgi:hypothetical protein
MPELDRDKVYRDFHTAVNMAAIELDRWLKTKDSRAVGFKGADGKARESVGHASGRRIILILGKKASELTDSDYQHMRKVVGYVKRHSAQEPANVATSRWRYSLMNWGRDPLKAH